jgi:L,D-peptidoglycan transpeptidase YkuD (ErfK/YbiS/YcfS/YnhG family)
VDIVVKSGTGGVVADWGAGERRAAVGHAGIGEKQREGDRLTPVGRWPLRRVLYRADRMAKPVTALPLAAIAPDSGWCDAPDDSNYNRAVVLPYAAGAERLWRDDGLYDLVVVAGFNDDPVVPGKGSAIFLHVAAPDYAPTEGCVALGAADLREAVAQLRSGDALVVA